MMDAEHQEVMENHPDIMRPMHEKPNFCNNYSNIFKTHKRRETYFATPPPLSHCLLEEQIGKEIFAYFPLEIRWEQRVIVVNHPDDSRNRCSMVML